MMEKRNAKTLWLAVLGVGLQAAGGICIVAATVAAMEETKQKVKQIFLKELNKQLESV